MRRFTIAMLAGLGALSTPLAAQGGGGGGGGGGERAATRPVGPGGVTIGMAGTVGGGWQVEALDVGYARAVRAGPFSVATLTARLGSFIDEGAIIGGSRGFVAGVTLAGRTRMTQVADVGSEANPAPIGLDLTAEATGYVGARSPLSVGSPWGAVSLLPGLRFGNANGAQFGLLVGPTVFLGHITQVRAFVGLRFEAPLARAEHQP